MSGLDVITFFFFNRFYATKQHKLSDPHKTSVTDMNMKGVDVEIRETNERHLCSVPARFQEPIEILSKL